jgi:hypothetical protein
MMTKLFVALGIAAIAISFSSSAFALNRAPLNPQPLPPRCVSGVHCPKANGGHSPHVTIGQPLIQIPLINCKPPNVAKQVKNSRGTWVWRCVKS